jgi:hypothetical protein
MLDRFLHQKRFPFCTALSIVTTLVMMGFILAANSSDSNGFEKFGIVVIAAAVTFAGLCLNFVWLVLAAVREEYRAVPIVLTGMVLSIGAYVALPYVHERLETASERSRTWSTIEDVFVQPDGRLLLVGTGLLRLFPDGQRDPSFHRDYSFVRRGSLPDPIREGLDRSLGECAAMAPNGDLLLGARGWVGRVRPDGSDAPVLDRACRG